MYENMKNFKGAAQPETRFICLRAAHFFWITDPGLLPAISS